MLVKYVKNKRGQRIGVVVAIARDRIGWSKCNFAKGDKFDRDRGKMIASKRAEKYQFQEIQVNKILLFRGDDDKLSYNILPHPVLPDFIDMVGRAKNYFKVLPA